MPNPTLPELVESTREFVKQYRAEYGSVTDFCLCPLCVYYRGVQTALTRYDSERRAERLTTPDA